jgi:hypothetical protein
MKRPSPLFAKVRNPRCASRERGFADRNAAVAATGPDTELWGGLERDLGRLQSLMDQAMAQLRDAFEIISVRLDAAGLPVSEHELVMAQVRRVLTGFQFHDIASQMIASMRDRAALLELAALVAAPADTADGHALLLARAAHLTQRCPGDSWSEQGGDVELF